MKKILVFMTAVLAIAAGCTKEYEFNTDFTVPTQLVSPDPVTLDVTSSDNVVLSWKGGSAADGGIVLYNVLFDKEGGDFKEPLAVMQSDLGAMSSLTISHASLNALARKAGIAPNRSGNIIWTVSAAKGGETRMYNGHSTIALTRGEGIDNIPEHLYISGSAAVEAGQEFRVAEEGLYVIYTEVGNGEISFTSERDGGFMFYADSNLKLNEGTGAYSVTTAPSTGLVRITVNFNTLGVSIDEIGKQVRAIWGANSADIAILEYTGNGNFVGDGDVVFLGPGRDGTPDWCSWVEERYYFIAEVNGEEMCWGSTFGSGAWTPDGTDEFFYVVENNWDQWSNLWKMDHAYDNCHVTFTIFTNKDNQMTHSYTGGAIQYEQPTTAPAELYLGGNGAEAQSQPMTRTADGKFVIFNKLTDGNITFVDENGTKYFADSENKLFIGSPKTAVTASEGIRRITVDFGSKTVSYDEIDNTVYLKWAATSYDVVTLTYQGLGKYAGEGDITFLGPGRDGTPDWCSWAEERYYFIVKINGADMCWGRLDGVSSERPDGEVSDDFYNLGEFEWSQWDHCWKMASALDESTATVTINTNDMTHSFVIATEDPVTPSIAPESLTISGEAAETEGAQFRKVSDGVFQIITKLSAGSLNFKSGKTNYFFDTESNLFQGKGESTVAASESGFVTRITVDFQTASVKLESIDEWLHLKFAADYRDVANLQYQGNGIWKASGVNVKFIDPNDSTTNPPSWLSWLEERYYIIVKVDGIEKCWGRLDSVSGNDLKPDGDPHFYDIEEYTWSQWDHCWKFAPEMNGATVDITVNFNDDGVFKHTITKK